MQELEVITWVLIGLASVMAGFIDSAVGGGGMITVPTLLTVLPKVEISLILGTNKLSAIGGTTMAALQYARKIKLQWRLIIPAMLAAGAASILGAFLVPYIPVTLFKQFLPPVLACLLIYTLINKNLGQTSKNNTSNTNNINIKTEDNKRPKSPWTGALLGGLIGLYDGIFGPGTGSFLALLWIKGYGFDFMHATAHAKWVNLATNFGAIVWFGSHGNVYIPLGLMMAACNIVGAFFGSRITLKYGNAFVRRFFIVIVMALIARTSYDAYFR